MAGSRIVNLTLLFAFLTMLLAGSLYAGNETSGGGQGVEQDDGGLEFLDLIENPEQIRGAPVNIFEDERTRASAEYALARVAAMEKEFPRFAKASLQVLRNIKWSFTQQTIPFINDAGVLVPGMVQPAMQSENADVTIDEKLFIKMSVRNRAALFVHELLLAKLGLKFPRAPLRAIMLQLFSANPDWAKIRSELDSVHPAIARGEYRFKMKIQNNEWHGISTCLNAFANNVRVFNLG
ncbi:MAG TPA: hypothetical protein VJB59_01455 [Bdellovibrionota bacterium]|nr:hypothetical protein [Bdellovibrionota bacterium]